jgi:tetratricopeptide (TPR) repeat protein
MGNIYWDLYREEKMGSLAGRFRIVFLISLFLFSCSHTPEEIVSKHTRRGDAYLEKGKFKEAVLEYMNAVKASPDNAALRWKLAKTALEAKDIRTAYAELQKTVELDSANFEAKKILGEIYVVMGETDRASQIADNLFKTRPNDPQGYILKSALASRWGKLDEAIAHMRKAVELEPQNARSILTIGNLYLLKRNPKTAKEWFDRALAADPNSVDVHITRGNFFFASGDNEEGEKEYRRAIELSKEKEDIRIFLAQHYLFQGRIEESEKELNSLIKEMNSLKARKVLAEIKLDTGKTEEAKSEVKAILRENEKDPDGTYLKGRIALAENRLDDAKALFGEVIKQVPAKSQARLFQGITETMLGRADAGKKEVEEAVRLDPGNVRARLLLGNIHLKNNDPVAAEKEAIEVLRRNPANFQASLLYGDAYLLRKDWMKSEQVYGMIIRQMPKSPVGYFKMGLSKKMQRKPAEAASYFSRAMERNPGDITTTSEFILTLADSGQVDKARSVLGEYLAKEPKNPRVWEMAGRFHVASRKPGEAESAFLKAVELDPKSPQLLYDLGVLYASQKKFPEAEAKLKAAVEKDDRNVSARTMLGVVLQSQGKIEDANRHYRRILEIDPKNALAANNLASNLADHGGNLDEAIRLAQVAQVATPENPVIWDTLGWLYYRKGLIESAIPLLSEAARKLDKNAVVRYHHGMALAKTGKKREAVRELNAALSLDPNFPEAGEARKVLENLR